MIFQYQMEGKAFKCVDALVLLCICIYICICINNCIVCGKQSSQVTRDKTMVGDWLWQAKSETFVFVFHVFVFLCLYLFRILCGKQAGGKTMVGDGLWHPRGETSPTFALLHFCLESIWVVSLDRVQLSYVFGPSPFRLYFFCDYHTNVHSLHLIIWI